MPIHAQEKNKMVRKSVFARDINYNTKQPCNLENPESTRGRNTFLYLKTQNRPQFD